MKKKVWKKTTELKNVNSTLLNRLATENSSDNKQSRWINKRSWFFGIIYNFINN
jgi:hypothetical protein